jgi:flap endonuclease-1
LDSIRGIGPHKALSLIKEHKTLEKIIQVIDKKKYPVPEDWPYQEARELFKNPDVTDPETIDVLFAAHHLVKMVTSKRRRNCRVSMQRQRIQVPIVRLTNSEERVRKAVQKLNKSKSGSTQGRLDGFFKAVPKTEAEIKAVQKRKVSRSYLRDRLLN